jgi:uncharacterized NAD(P)/FAD-binding protein YdhS
MEPYPSTVLRPAVVIIGGGFCGTAAAINLIRHSDGPLDIAIVNHRRPAIVGVAYGTGRPEHLLNVSVGKMSVLADRPRHFLDWLRNRPEFCDIRPSVLNNEYVPRVYYGDYLRETFADWSDHIAPQKNIHVRHFDGEAIDIHDRDGRAEVRIADGRTVECDKVVLATGNLPPAPLPGDDRVIGHSHFVANAWGRWDDRLPNDRGAIVLIGTSLTGIDVFLTLEQMNWRGRVIAISRHGLLPLPYFPDVDYSVFDEDPSQFSLHQLVSVFRRQRRAMRAAGIPLAILVDACRPYTQRIWNNLSIGERNRFLRWFQTGWKVTRHRIPESVHERLVQAQVDGRLELVRGSVRGLEPIGDKIRVSLRDGDRSWALDVGAVFNCTGPQQDYLAAGGPLFDNLVERGAIVADDMNLGLRVDEDFAVIDRAGRRSPRLFALGNLLKGTLWETTGVPEMRGQANHIAKAIVAELARSS